MNLRNTLMGEKEEEQAENTITFSLNGEKGAGVSYSCDAVSLAAFLLNLIDIGNSILEDEEIPEHIADQIRAKWIEDSENLSNK